MRPLGILQVLLLTITSAFSCVAAAQNPVVSEQDLKAAYLYHFIQFTEWPAITAAEKAFTICADAKHSLLPTLQKLLEKQVHGATLYVMTDFTSLERCSVLLASADRINTKIRDQAVQFHVLTISDDTAVSSEDVVISLKLRDGRVVFSINKNRAEMSGLTISSRLLRLAETVQ